MNTDQNILLTDIKAAWSHAVRAFNCAENSQLRDTATSLAEVIVKLSQILEFQEAMSESKT